MSFAACLAICTCCLAAQGRADSEIRVCRESRDGIVTAWGTTTIAEISSEGAGSVLFAPVQRAASWRRDTTTLVIWSCERVAQHTRSLSLDDRDRVTLEPLLESMLMASLRIADAPSSIEVLEQRLRDLAGRLGELARALVAVAATAGESRDRVFMMAIIVDHARDHVDGVRYLAGQLRLYGRDPTRQKGAECVRRAGASCVAGEPAGARTALLELRALIAGARAAEFLGNRLGAVRSRIDGLLSDWSSVRDLVTMDAEVHGELDDIGFVGAACIERTASPEPARRATALSLGVAAEADTPAGELRLELATRRMTHDDAGSRDKDTSQADVEFGTAFDWLGRDVEIGFLMRRTDRQGTIDRELRPEQSTRAANRVAEIRESVSMHVASTAAKGRLRAPLDKALTAIDESRLRDAVTALEQFCDQAWKEAFGTTVSEVLAAQWVEGVREVLPRRREFVWSIPASFSTVVEEWDVDVEVELSARSAPTDSVWARRERALSVEAERKMDPWAMGAEMVLQAVQYPWDLAESFRSREFSFRVAGSQDAAAELDAAVRTEWTTYPLDPKRDVWNRRWELEGVLRQGEWALTLDVSRTGVRYPGNPARDTEASAWGVRLAALLAHGECDVSWGSSWKRSSAGELREDRCRLELQRKDDVARLSLALAWSRAITMTGETDEPWKYAVEVALAVEF